MSNTNRLIVFLQFQTANLESLDWSPYVTNHPTAQESPRSVEAVQNGELDLDQLSLVLPIYRVVTLTILASMIWKYAYFIPIFQSYAQLELSDSFFPSFFTNNYVLAGLYLAPIAFGIIALFTRSVLLLRTQALTTLGCMFGLCIHQGSYNDVTFVTCLWVSLWCVWYTLKINEPPEELIKKSQRFSLLIISLVFLGGAAGKWTPGYWSGEVIYEIYFSHRDFWFFNLLRNQLDTESLRNVATLYSRVIVISETACSFLWLLKPKYGGMIAIAMLLGITFLSNLLLFSVTFCLIGLAIAAIETPRWQATTANI